MAERCPIKALQYSLLKSSYVAQHVRKHTHTHTVSKVMGSPHRAGDRGYCTGLRLGMTTIRSHVVQFPSLEQNATKKGPDSTLVAELGASHLSPLALAQG